MPLPARADSSSSGPLGAKARRVAFHRILRIVLEIMWRTLAPAIGYTACFVVGMTAGIVVRPIPNALISDSLSRSRLKRYFNHLEKNLVLHFL